jgi:hypothetical protein
MAICLAALCVRPVIGRPDVMLNHDALPTSVPVTFNWSKPLFRISINTLWALAICPNDIAVIGAGLATNFGIAVHVRCTTAVLVAMGSLVVSNNVSVCKPPVAVVGGVHCTLMVAAVAMLLNETIGRPDVMVNHDPGANDPATFNKS